MQDPRYKGIRERRKKYRENYTNYGNDDKCFGSGYDPCGCGGGPRGHTGSRGYQGAQGAQGAQGVAGSGSQGPQGVQGPRGFQGVPGSGSPGPVGPQGCFGRRGAPGPIGSGDTGVTGPQGCQGMVGAGVQGPQGYQGVVGAGSPGPQGVTGATGVTGVTGVVGPVLNGITNINGVLNTDIVIGPSGTGNLCISNGDLILADGSTIRPKTMGETINIIDNTVLVLAIPSGSTTIPSGTPTLIVFDNEQRDVTNSYDTNTSKFTAPVTGVYHICAGINIQNNDQTPTYSTMTFRVNGDDIFTPKSQLMGPYQGPEMTQSFWCHNACGAVLLNENAMLQVYVTMDGDMSSDTLGQQGFFYVKYIGP